MIDIRSIKPINRHLIVQKCVNDHIRSDDGSVLLYKPDEIYETTNWALVVDIASDCVVFTHEDKGKYVMCPEMSHGLHRIGEEHESSYFMVREDVIMRDNPYIVEK